jgi:hypothetical protein
MRLREIITETWGKIGHYHLVDVTSQDQLSNLLRSANRRNRQCDLRGFWFPENDKVVVFSGWSLTHDDVIKEYPEARIAVRLTFPFDEPNILMTGSRGKSDELKASHRIQTIMGNSFSVEEGVY